MNSKQNIGCVIVFLTLMSQAPLMANEVPYANVEVISDQIIDTITPDSNSTPGFKPHIRFPGIDKRGNGDMRIWYNVGQTWGSVSYGKSAISTDDGINWSNITPTLVVPLQKILPSGQTSYGFIVQMDLAGGTNSWTNARYSSTDGGATWTRIADASFSTGAVTYTTMFYSNCGEVVVSGSTWFITAYGKRVGQSTYEMVLFVSTNSGASWSRRATIAQYVAGQNVSMGEEGPTEGDIVLLDNGNLLAVYRTGQPYPTCDVNAVAPAVCWGISSDSGSTWSSPKMIGVTGQLVQLHKLDNGMVAMTYGRYGCKVIFVDATGLRWTKPFIIYNGPTCGTVGFEKADDGKYIFIYAQSSFYNPSYDGNPPTCPSCYVYKENNQEVAHMRVARLSISFDSTWAYEYHADKTPDQLTPAWTPNISGSPSVRSWADQGQDYIRIDSGQSGTSRYCNYALSGSGSAWGQMYFEDGVVVEFRARVIDGNTPQGAASVFAGDGAGYIVVELTGTGVNLEGQGGNGSQVTYTMNTSAWHSYRLVIKPDPTVGNAVRGKVYLDGSTIPILTNYIATTPGYNEIRFGDQTGSNNGTSDYEFIRFDAL